MHDLDVLGKCLDEDGFRYSYEGKHIRLYRSNALEITLSDLKEKTFALSLDTVLLDVERARHAATHDPEEAITAACSLLESLFRTIILACGEPMPDKKDISGLWRVVQRLLNLSPDRSDLAGEVADDIRKLLGSVSSSVCQIGSLRTHAGDAHGRERGRQRVDARIARLAVNSAQAAALFCIETWEKRFPGRQLLPDTVAAT